jgi:hypothetical protein
MDHLTAYQNAHGEIIVKTLENENIRHLQLYNSNGMCLTDRLNHESVARLTTENLPKGLYIIRAITDNNILTAKITL